MFFFLNDFGLQAIFFANDFNFLLVSSILSIKILFLLSFPVAPGIDYLHQQSISYKL